MNGSTKKHVLYSTTVIPEFHILPPSVVYRYCFINPNKLRRSFTLELCCVISVNCDHPLLQLHTGTGLPRTSAPTPLSRRSRDKRSTMETIFTLNELEEV